MTPISLKIGPYSLHSIPTGFFGLDGGAMFGTVPKVLWEKTNPPDESNRILMEARSLLLKSPGHNVLIDVGNGGDFVEKYGEKLGSKFPSMYNIYPDGATLRGSLAKQNLSTSDIHSVVITHLHFDHAGGVTYFNGTEIAPAFSKAKYFLQKQNLFTAEKPNIRERASYFEQNFRPLQDAKVLEIIDGPETNFLPLMTPFISNGHTQGHQGIVISDGTTTVVYCGDIIPTVSHVKLAWIMGYDLDPLTIIQEKRALLEQAAQAGWYLFFEHDPYCELAKVAVKGSDFEVTERFVLNGK